MRVSSLRIPLRLLPLDRRWRLLAIAVALRRQLTLIQGSLRLSLIVCWLIAGRPSCRARGCVRLRCRVGRIPGRRGRETCPGRRGFRVTGVHRRHVDLCRIRSRVAHRGHLRPVTLASCHARSQRRYEQSRRNGTRNHRSLCALLHLSHLARVAHGRHPVRPVSLFACLLRNQPVCPIQPRNFQLASMLPANIANSSAPRG